MKIEVNQLSVEVTVTNPQIKKSDDLEVRVVFTNTSTKKLRLNALFLDFGMIMLAVRKSDRTPVFLSPPPVPPVDDGETGRIDLEPGGSATFVYRGVNLFGEPLALGAYQVRFRYENTTSGHQEWTGTITSDWLSFEVSG